MGNLNKVEDVPGGSKSLTTRHVGRCAEGGSLTKDDGEPVKAGKIGTTEGPAPADQGLLLLVAGMDQRTLMLTMEDQSLWPLGPEQ